MPQYKIVVAEDSPTQAAQIRIMLEGAGYQVHLARDGQQALDQIRADPPELVVTDLDMPEMNGLELVEALHIEKPRLPVILITSKGSEEIAAQALRAGTASYVPKRYLPSDICNTISRILAIDEAARAGRELRHYVKLSELQLELENDDTLVAPLIVCLQQQVTQLGVCQEGDLLQIATALDEALMNAIVHGNLEVSSQLREVDEGRAYLSKIRERRAASPYKERRVTVHARSTQHETRFEIHDQGPGFNPNDVPDPTDPSNLEKISGRGLLLIHAFMDEVSHNDKGNQITMIKRAHK